MAILNSDVVAQKLGLDEPYQPVSGQWSAEKAQAWYAKLPWLAGTNYYPATAINQLEMWQQDTFDPQRIKLEMRWSQNLGFNTHRVYLHDLLWQADEKGLYERMDEFLDICAEHGTRPFFCFFDDCHNPFPKPGKQPPPVPGYHNSGWVTCPSRKDAVDFFQGDASAETVARLKGYVQRTMNRFGGDERVLMWELYNEPGRGSSRPDPRAGGNLNDMDFGDQSIRLVHESFVWAREVGPNQPVSSNSTGCVGEANWTVNVLNSDVHSIHHYQGSDSVKKLIEDFESYGRPIFMTEYLAREMGSTIEDIMPILKEHKVAAINWGFVAGKTGTIWPWRSRELGPNGEFVSADSLRAKGKIAHLIEELPEPKVWFHEILRYDGTPYREEEVDIIKQMTGA